MKEQLNHGIQARIPDSIRKKIDHYRAETNLSDADVMRLALKKFLSKVATK